MKLVTAVIKPYTWEAVRSALERVGITGMTVCEVSGSAGRQGPTEVFRGAEHEVALVPRIRIEVVVEDAEVGEVVTAVVDSARTGKVGDGMVWMVPLDSVVPVRTGDRNGVRL